MHANSMLRAPLVASALALAAACGGEGETSVIVITSFAPLVPATDVLLEAEVDALVQRAAEAVDSPQLALAVVDRNGALLRLWNRTPGSTTSDYDNLVAVSIARSAALLASSQTPVTSRAHQAVSSYHYPAQFAASDWIGDGVDDGPGDLAVVPDPNSYALRQRTLGLANTPPAPFWQQDMLGRGAPIESAATTPPTAYDAGMSLPLLTNPDGSAPSPGFTPLPGSVPLYKRAAATIATPGTYGVERRLVGAIGAFVTDPTDPALRRPLVDPAEHAAERAARSLDPLSGEPYAWGSPGTLGVVFLEGVLLPYVAAHSTPPGVGPGTYDSLLTVAMPASDGSADPFGFLIGARASMGAVAFAEEEVATIVDCCETAALMTHSATRLPKNSACRVAIAVTDMDGVILGLFRMEDAAVGAAEAAVAAARNAVFYSDPTSVDSADLPNPSAGLHPMRNVFAGSPAALAILTDPLQGIAVSTRALWFLSQPFYPPGIDGTAPAPKQVDQISAASGIFTGGPLYNLAIENRKPFRHDQMGFAEAADIDPGQQDGTQNGICFFPGGVPIYRDGLLMGGLGVAGDGAGQCDYVIQVGLELAEQTLTDLFGPIELQPPPAIRCDKFPHGGLLIPYLKFPQNPQG